MMPQLGFQGITIFVYLFEVSITLLELYCVSTIHFLFFHATEVKLLIWNS